jgi:hypothetical protein
MAPCFTGSAKRRGSASGDDDRPPGVAFPLLLVGLQQAREHTLANEQEDSMTKRWMVVTLVLVTSVLAADAWAKPPQRYRAKPFQVVGAAGDCGEGSVAGEDTVSAAWVTHQGLKDAGKSDHALLLQKSGAGDNCAWAGVAIYNVAGIELTELGYDVRDDGDCTADSPRFEVEMTDGLHTAGCDSGTVTETLVDARGQSWSRKRWTNDDLVPPVTDDSGTVVSISIVFDSGEDEATELGGRTYLDNVDVNGTLMGKPGLAKAAH